MTMRRRDAAHRLAPEWRRNNPVQKTVVSAFTQTLAGLGWTDGRNVRMDLRWGGMAAAWFLNFNCRKHCAQSLSDLLGVLQGTRTSVKGLDQ